MLKAGKILDSCSCSSKQQEKMRVNAHWPWSADLRLRCIVAFVHFFYFFFWIQNPPPKNSQHKINLKQLAVIPNPLHTRREPIFGSFIAPCFPPLLSTLSQLMSDPDGKNNSDTTFITGYGSELGTDLWRGITGQLPAECGKWKR